MNIYPRKLYKAQRDAKFDPTQHFALAKNPADEAALRKQGYTDIAAAMAVATQSGPYALLMLLLERHGIWLIFAAVVFMLSGLWVALSFLEVL